MYITKWNRPMIASMMNRFMSEDNKSNCGTCAPATNIVDNKEAINIEMAVPGRNKKDIEINVEKNILTVSYKNGKEEEKEYKLHEFGKGSFRRSFALPEDIKVEAIDANYEKGILQLSLPRKEEVLVKRQIEIS